MSGPALRSAKPPAFDIADLVRIRTSVWFEMYGAIKPKAGAILKAPDLRANYLQRKESEVIAYCLVHDIPCRLLKLKPRQKGSSTFSVASVYHRLSNFHSNACIMGGSHKQGANLFKMLRLYAEHDTFNPRNPCKVLEGKAKWANGSECVQETAANPEAGRSGTYEVLLATEVARWAEEGVSNAADVLAGILKCVPYKAKTLVELETTANGASGDFYERWQKAITFEELQAGRRGFVKLFAPWFVFEDSVMDPKAEGIASEEDLSEKERELAAQWKLSLEQVAWMRWAIREECKSDFDVFCEDYPFDEESAFRSSGRRRFNANILKRMQDAARLYPPEFGVLEPQERDKFNWRRTAPEEARLLKWEPPKAGCRYLLSVDVMTGATQAGGKDPDNHAVGVWRAGMFVNGMGYVRPRLVARLISDWPTWERDRKYVLTWDIDVLEEQVWRLAVYYGNCLIVPEINMDRGLVELLRLRNAHIYEREQFNRREQLTKKALGWLTTAATREMAIEFLARGVREFGQENAGVDIHCPISIYEMQHFVIKENGRSEAMSPAHDDTVLQNAIALATMDGATTYSEPRIDRPLPPDLLKLERESGGGRTGLAMRW
jgi:hypothetical protein